MDDRQWSPITVLTDLLQLWVDTSFPQPRTEHDIGMLNGALWIQLSNMLCGDNMRRQTAFMVEVSRHRDTGRRGDPPNQALAQRLEELAQFGMRRLFLVIAARQALDLIIAQHFPDKLETWKHLADNVLPTSIQTGVLDSEGPNNKSGWTVYGPLLPE